METKQVVFNKDLEGKKITVTRSFDAPLDQVWDAWTDPTIREQWWAPKPYRAETKSMDFKEGGTWLYAMIGPKGDQQWSTESYDEIVPKERIISRDAFTDENGTINTAMPQMTWQTEFDDSGEDTEVTIEITLETEADMQKILDTGFQEGFTAGLDNLDQYLSEH
jgi:uncharacterized protein YndB with AHSA1/START domain